MSPKFVRRGGWRWVGLVAVGLLGVGWTSLARADGKDDVEAAVGKSYAAKSYTWVSHITDEPEVHAKAETDGFTSVRATVDAKPRAVVVQEMKCAVETEAGWESAKDLNWDATQKSMVSWLDHFQKFPLLEVGLTLHDVPTMQATGGGQ